MINTAKQIAIAGISGYLGSSLGAALEKKGYLIKGISRQQLYGPTGELALFLEESDVVINLAGAPILKRWTKKNKKVIYESRVATTRNLARALALIPDKKRPKKWIGASAIGIYTCKKIHDESSEDFDRGFIGKLIQDWEGASQDLPSGVNRIIFRIGLVLGKKSEILKKMKWIFQLGLGATIGKGRQPFPYIHIDDVVKAFVSAINNDFPSGYYNLVAPESITNQIFTKSFSGKLKKPAFLMVPSFVLRLLYGKAAVLLTDSPAVFPKKLINMGYDFQYKTIDETMKDIILSK